MVTYILLPIFAVVLLHLLFTLIDNLLTGKDIF